MFSRFLIYGLIDPDTQELRYVGRSSNGLTRPKKHWKHSSTRDSLDHCHNWVRNVLSRGKEPEIEILEEFSSADFLNEAEVFWIGYFRMIGCQLTNLSNGGEGQSGFSHSKESKEKIRIAHLGKPSGMKGKIPWNKGKIYRSPKIQSALAKRNQPREKGRFVARDK